MSATTAGRRLASPHHYRVRRYLAEAACLALGFVLLVWSLAPIYNIIVISLEGHDDVFSGAVWPPHPSLHSFVIVFTEGFWYLENFWHQFGNSFFVGLMTMFLTLLIGSLASFTVGRMHLRQGWLLSNAALMTYVIPASFLAIPFYRIMQIYGLSNNLWSVIAAMVTFATPYSIFIFSQYGKSIPMELDESARIDGANPLQIYYRIYLPLMAPALVAVGTYALLLGLERVPVQFPFAVHAKEHDRGGRARAVPQQRRGTVELHDGHRHHLCSTANHIVLWFPPVHVGWPDHGWREGLSTTAAVMRRY